MGEQIVQVIAPGEGSGGGIGGVGNSHYGGIGTELLPNRLERLPPGAVKPYGWLAAQLDLLADGLTGRLEEISEFLTPENGWLTGTGPGWEEQPYWFRGFVLLAILTGRDELLSRVSRWTDSMLATRRPDGFFGPAHLADTRVAFGHHAVDLWGHMTMSDALEFVYEHTGDERVLDLLAGFYRWAGSLPEERFLPFPFRTFSERNGVIRHLLAGSGKLHIQMRRAGELVPHLHWLYDRTGEHRFLETAERVYGRLLEPMSEWLDIHVINYIHRHAFPGYFYRQFSDPGLLAETEYWYRMHLDAWGGQPRGIFGADELVRPDHTDPRQAFETCGFTEFLLAFGRFGSMTGNTVYADRMEDLAFNHLPAAFTPDHTSLHYLTATNQPQLDAGELHDYQNKGHQIDYSPWRYRCCRHNHALAWPLFAHTLYRATADDGLATWLYSPSEMSALAGTDAIPVRIRQQTDYPFSGSISLTVETDAPTRFPLYLRIPRWCRGGAVRITSRTPSPTASATAGDRPELATGLTGGGYVRIERDWDGGETLELELPMEAAVHRWPRTGAATVDRGPLSYSVRIEEKWRRSGGTDEWPEWEALPASPWNYGLVGTSKSPAGTDGFSVEVASERSPGELPWSVDAAPVELRARARRIPEWGLDKHGTIMPLTKGPVRSSEPDEWVRLVPLGCARLRVGCLPVVSDATWARAWE